MLKIIANRKSSNNQSNSNASVVTMFESLEHRRMFSTTLQAPASYDTNIYPPPVLHAPSTPRLTTADYVVGA